MNPNKENGNSGMNEAVNAAQAGKAIADITKGAASGGLPGVAAATIKHAKIWIGAAIALSIVPILIVCMLPTIIFGPVFSDGTDSKNGILDDTTLIRNVQDLNTSISMVLSNSLQGTLNEIERDFAGSGCYGKEVLYPYGADIQFNANSFISMYCASKDQDVTSISKEDLLLILRRHTSELYSYSYYDEQRIVIVEKERQPEDGEPEEGAAPEFERLDVTYRIYTVKYNGEPYFASRVFKLTDNQKRLASSYSQNLSILLNDGMYQVLSSNDFSSFNESYEGVVFTDGLFPVQYYNQLDVRWNSMPYGTDNIGGYACGPTAMSIVISSLTEDKVDPPYMAQWAYENGYWCSQSGSYHTLIPGAARAWRLPVQGYGISSAKELREALKDGKLIVALMSKGHFTSGGHFIVLRGLTDGGKVLVADPSSYTRSLKEWDISIILNEASRSAGAGGPFWVIG